MQRTGAVAVGIVVALVSVASADAPTPPTDQRQQQRLAAEKLETEGRTTGDSAKFVACGKAYLDLYNADPKAAGGDELLYNAAVCFDRGKSVGAALQSLALLRKSVPSSKLEGKALLRQGSLNARIGAYDEAATRYEDYARKYAGEKDAAAALSDALYFRLTFGPDTAAAADANLVAKLYGAKRPTETAEAMWALTALYARKGGEALIAHLRDYVRRFGTTDRVALAYLKLGEELWHRSCPVREVDGLCVKVVRERIVPALKLGKLVKLAAAPTQCGPKSTPKVVTVARDARKVAEAQVALTAAIKLVERRGDPDNAEGRAVVARARLLVNDKTLEAYLAIGFPKGLNFDPSKPPIKAASVKRFNDWIAQKTKLGSTATTGYEAVLGIKDASMAIAAAARLGQVAQSFSDALSGAEIPADVRSGEFATEKSEAFCNSMMQVAEPLEARAHLAYGVCASKAGELGVYDEFTKLCFRELARLDPRNFIVGEQFALPAVPTPLTLELPIRSTASLSTAFQGALAKFVETEKLGWAVPSCRSHAAQFAAIAKANPTFVDVQYMVGLSFHRCGLADDARRAYEATTKLRADHAAAQSNLAELQWRAGNRDVAIRGWEATLMVDPKLYAAHVNLAAAAIAELRALPDADPARAKLTATARLHLQSALAVDDSDPGAYVAFASLEIDRPIVARFYIAEATKRAQKQLVVPLAEGAIAARNGTWGGAVARFELAVAQDPSSSDAHLSLGLADLQFRKYDAARTELALVKTPSYDLHVATGVALRGSGRVADAVAAYDKAIALAPNRVEAHFNSGIAHLVTANGDATDLVGGKAAFARAAAAFKRAAAVATGELKADATAWAETADRAIVQIDAVIKAGVVAPPVLPAPKK